MAKSYAYRASLKDQLQRFAGQAGEVLPRVARGDDVHPAQGWYWRPAEPVPGCRCDHCRSARAGEPAFLGDHSTVALVELSRYQEVHPT